MQTYTKSIQSCVQSCKLLAQQKLTCSKATIETLEKVWNMFKVNNKDTRTTSMTSFSSVSIVKFEQVNVCWEIKFASFLHILAKQNKL